MLSIRIEKLEVKMYFKHIYVKISSCKIELKFNSLFELKNLQT